jgi:hypothetical protein
MGLGILTSFAAAAEGVGGRSLNSGTEEEIRCLFAAEGGLEVKARPTGLLSWRFGNMAGVAMAESSASSLLLALLETLECMLPTGVRLRQPEAASAAGEGVIRGS